MYKPYLNHREREYKSAFIAFLQNSPKETTYAITLQTDSKNMKWLPKSVQERRECFDKLLSQWDKKLCRHFLGPFYNKPSKRDKRQSGYAFPEKFDESPHYHLIIDIKDWDAEEFKVLAEEIWRDLWPAGTVDTPHIYGDRWETYSTKNFNPSEPDGCIFIPYVPK